MKAYYKTSVLLGCLMALLLHQQIIAQSPIEALTSTYVTTNSSVNSYAATPAPNSGSFASCVNQSYSYTFNNGTTNGLRLTGITTNSANYFLVNQLSAVIRLRRVNNTGVNGTRNIIFLESTASTATNCPGSNQFAFKSPYQDNMELFLNNNYINQGTDNIFANTGNGDGNNNNIERVDVIFPAGVSSDDPDDAGFALLDRGNNNAHDAFRIVAITGIDINGNPTSFGSVRTCIGGTGSANGSWGHPSLANGNRNLSVYVMRKDAGDTYLRSSAAINQQLGGVFFSLADLGINANQIIYGYALLSNDGIANPTSAQLLNITNTSVYPTNTNESIGGGLDLIAVNAFFQTGPVMAREIVDLKGTWKKEQALLQWTIKDIPAESQVILERSTDGIYYNELLRFRMPATYHSGTFTDALTTTAYYRLKIVTPQSQVIYSTTISVKKGIQALQIYPTRITPFQTIHVKGLQDGVYTVTFTAASGVMYVATLKVTNGKGNVEAPIAGFAKGVYFVSVKENSVSTTTKLIVY